MDRRASHRAADGDRRDRVPRCAPGDCRTLPGRRALKPYEVRISAGSFRIKFNQHSGGPDQAVQICSPGITQDPSYPESSRGPTLQHASWTTCGLGSSGRRRVGVVPARERAEEFAAPNARPVPAATECLHVRVTLDRPFHLEQNRRLDAKSDVQILYFRRMLLLTFHEPEGS